MDKAIAIVPQLWQDIFAKLETVQLDIGGMNVSLPAILFAFMVTGIVISVFWKGART